MSKNNQKQKGSGSKQNSKAIKVFKKRKKAGRPKEQINDETKKLAWTYVRASGYSLTSLAGYLRMGRGRLTRIFKEDPNFKREIVGANNEFRAEIVEKVKKRKPDFLLETKFRNEFKKITKVEATLDPSDEFRRLMKRINE